MSGSGENSAASVVPGTVAAAEDTVGIGAMLDGPFSDSNG